MRLNSQTEILKLKKEETNSFMEAFELMGNIGLGVWHYGLFHNEELISAVSYGTTCFGNAKGFIREVTESLNCKVIQICRGATKQNTIQYAASRLISNANKLVAEEIGNLIIVGYSDPEWKENGDIYQACNAIYTGMTDPKNQSNYIIKNEFMTGWEVFKYYGTRDFPTLKMIDPMVQKIPLKPKHRYIFTCGTKCFKQNASKILNKYRIDYPKRGSDLPNMY